MLAMPRVIAWRIHHVAYVENLKPLRQSNFSTACIRPRLPSWMRSSSGRPDAWYFLAIDTTSRRFDCTNVRSASSPSRAVRRSSRFLAGGERPCRRRRARSRAALPASICLRQADLVVLGEQRVLPDVGEVEPDEIFFVPLDTLLRHAVTLRLVGAPATRIETGTGCGACSATDVAAVARSRYRPRQAVSTGVVRKGGSAASEQVVALLGVEVEVVEDEVEDPHDRPLGDRARLAPTTLR